MISLCQWESWRFKPHDTCFPPATPPLPCNPLWLSHVSFVTQSTNTELNKSPLVLQVTLHTHFWQTPRWCESAYLDGSFELVELLRHVVFGLVPQSHLQLQPSLQSQLVSLERQHQRSELTLSKIPFLVDTTLIFP